MNVLKRLAASRKAMAFASTIVLIVAVKVLKLDPDTSRELVTAIAGLGGLWIAAIAYEDAAAKKNGQPPELPKE